MERLDYRFTSYIAYFYNNREERVVIEELIDILEEKGLKVGTTVN